MSDAANNQKKTHCFCASGGVTKPTPDSKWKEVLIPCDFKDCEKCNGENGNPLRDFYNSLNNIITSFNPDIIVGDFNINIFSTSNNIVHIMNQQGYIRCPMSREFTTVKFNAIDVAFAKNNVNFDVLESYFSDDLPLIYNF